MRRTVDSKCAGDVSDVKYGIRSSKITRSGTKPRMRPERKHSQKYLTSRIKKT